MGDLVALAAEGDPVFTSITVNKVFRDIYGAEKYNILITGNNFTLDGRNIVEVGIMGADGTVKAFAPTYTSKTILQYELQPDQISGNLFIDGISIDISEGDMPFITNKTPTTGIVDSSGEAKITLIGSGFQKLSDTLKASLFQGNTEHNIPKGTSDTLLESAVLSGKTGTWSVQFKKTGKALGLKKADGADADLIISHRYMDMFSVLNKLDVSDKIDLIPTQGPVESIAMLQAEDLKPTNEMSVFFLKSLDDPYLATHMGINENYRRDLKLQKDIFSFTVPKALTPGSYYVVLTNEIDPKKDIKSQIKSYKILDSKFIVIDRKNMVLIDSISPNKGSSKGIDAIIKGINIARISSDIYENGTRDPNIDITTNTNKMTVKYTGGTYKMIGENGVKVDNLTREIKFLVGGEVIFREGSKLNESVYDYINVKVGENLDQQNLVKDVIVEITTTIEYTEGGIKKITEIFETYTLKNGFTYEALDYVPKITSIVPDRIPVHNNMEAIKGLKVAIIGENFLLYRYKDANEDIKYKYPKFDFGGQFTIDPNEEDIEIKILDKQGNQIDGTEGNDLGTKILLTIPGGKKVKEDILNSQLDFKITNPIRVPDSKDEGSSATYKFQFIKPEGDKTPFITNVLPDTITTSGHKGVKITGNNFSEKFNLYMDGEKITTAKRNGTGTQITFDAPPRNEGYVQLIVQNDDGSLATNDDLLYVKTYTDPKITDFNPKMGTAYTLVDLKGQNLVPPNPLVKDLAGVGFMKLIGTRIFIGGRDINAYTTDRKLKEYTTPDGEPILEAKDNNIMPSDYYHSIILEENGVYYKIYFDTTLGKYFLTDGDKDIHEITASGNKLYAKKGGDPQVELIISQTDIKLGSKTLIIKTPYATENIEGKEIITGNRVKVKNNNELYFIVPPQPREGYYDLAIVNPDTKKDERKGNAGFYYFFHPGEEPPKINDIKPSEGSTEGQYDIFIYGEKFVDRGPNEKTSVIIGGIKVPPQDIEVSPDGKTLKVKVPKYPGDLSKETDMDRKYVNVVVINPSGGSDRRIDGFAYIIPISHPKITKLILNKGSAAGGEIVTIEGSDFRYFEPYKDTNNNGTWDVGETFTDKNNNGEWDDLRKKEVFDSLKDNWEERIIPILPTVYFGGKIAKIKSFTQSTIDVETPKGVKGPVQVYLVNNDYGVSNTLVYTYEASSPKITSITPSTGRKQGGDKLEILGEGFAESNILIYTSLSNLPMEQKIVQVQFANQTDTNMSNKTLPIDNPGSGRIRDKIASAKAGQLELRYDATEDNIKLNITLTDNNIKYMGENIPYNNEEVFLPLNLLKNDKGQAYGGNELVRIILEKIEGASNTFRVIMDRGFSPNATLSNPGHINVVTPSYYTIGDIQVNLINPDGGIATNKFNYKNPDSDPKITNILKDGEPGYRPPGDGRTIVLVNYTGGNTIEIQGSDFRKPVKIKIGDITINPNIEYEPQNESISTKLIFKMPAVDKKYIGTYNRVVVENEDGGIASSEPIYIKFTAPESTGLAITKVTPNFGPTEGGTIITIEGKDFRKAIEGFPNGELKVYFGSGSKQIRVPAENIISIAFDKIVLKTPAYTAGTVPIKVENPDGNIVELPNAFTYVSNPKITLVVNPDNDKVVIEIISVEGGEKIKIIGNDFMVGARVVFNPVLKLVTDDKQATGDIITIGTGRYILESGTQGTEVEVLNGQTITVVTPPGKLDDKGVIVINPDKGATNVYNIVYGIPEIGAPLNVEAELVFDQFIRVHWSGVKDAFEYEIYISENGGKFEFIGSTELTSYAVQKIKPSTKYQFLVRAIGKYGTSKPIDESKSNIITTSRTTGPKDNDGALSENTVINRNGLIANIVIGTKDFTSKGMTIDLTRGNLAGVSDITIRIPASIIVNSSGKISILGKDYTMNFSPSIFKNSSMEDNKNNSNAGVVFKITAYKGNVDLKAGTTIVGQTYLLEGTTYVDKNNSKLDYLNGNLSFVLDQDNQIIQSRRIENIQMVRYDDNTKNWLNMSTINRLGLYTVIGSRR